ncbi:PEP-CTERM sorting domain-containing protein [Roseiarcus fermentans]|nr:PEP-CTERM sorting domain-containing protein [Roseiarcus fermentans]
MATTINFDDVVVSSGNYVTLSTYDGFTWSNAAVENHIPVGGYITGIVSQSNALFDITGNKATFTSNSGTFTFDSAYFASAPSSSSVVVSDNLGDSKTLAITSSPVLFTFDWSGVSSVSFKGGVAVVDNITFEPTVAGGTAAPEASTWAMMLFGFLGVGFLAQRRTRAPFVPAA